MKKNKVLGILAIMAVVSIYGISYISRDVIVKVLHPVVIVALQLLIMAFLFTSYNLINKIDFKIRKEDLFLLVLSGLFGTTFFHLFTVISVQYIGGTVSSLLFGFAAVFSLLIEFIFFKRKKTKLSILSVIVSLTGVYVVMGIRFTDLVNINFAGYFITLLSIVSWVTYCFLSDRLSDKYEKTIVLNVQAIVGLGTILPFLLVVPVSWSQLWKPTIFINIIILGIMNSTLAYFLNIYAIKKIGVTFTSIFMNFIPLVTIVAGLILYGTIPEWNQIIGGTIIITSVFILNRDQENLRIGKEQSINLKKIPDEVKT